MSDFFKKITPGTTYGHFLHHKRFVPSRALRIRITDISKTKLLDQTPELTSWGGMFRNKDGIDLCFFLKEVEIEKFTKRKLEWEVWYVLKCKDTIYRSQYYRFDITKQRHTVIQQNATANQRSYMELSIRNPTQFNLDIYAQQ